MPLETFFTPDDASEEPVRNLIMPGQISVFSDYCTDPPEAVAIICEEDDTRGRLVHLDLESKTVDAEGLPLYEVKEKDQIIAGQTIERQVETEDGERGTLVVKYVAYQAISYVDYASPN
jgi:hypothetical protein